MVTVRRATEEDRLGLFKLSAAMHAETDFACLRFNPHKALDNLGGWVHHKDGLMLVAADDGVVIGMLAATFKRPWFTDDEVASEDLFYVAQDRRGSRTAYRLMQAYIQACRDRGIKYLRAGISTGAPGKNAGRIYEHFGMRCTGACYSMNL